PYKVVDIGAQFSIRSVKIHWTEEGETGDYVTLSYCWNERWSLATTTTTQGFTVSTLTSNKPKEILGAIDLVRRLGLRFPWVDVLCIIQCAPEDGTRDISKMAQAYQS
ncbi:HET-domain-containing protein, partial [Karstenula rhodostoma CBS 690.94]